MATGVAESRESALVCSSEDRRRRLPRRNRADQARSALVLGLAIFVLLQLILVIARDRHTPELRDVPYAEKLTRLQSRMEGAPQHPLTIVMLGSSRTVFGLKAGRLEQPLTDQCGRPVVAFNFGIYGAGPVINLLTLRRLLADGIHPDLVLIEVLPPLLSSKPAVLEINRIAAEQLGRSDLRLVERFGQGQRDLRRDWWLAYPVPCYSQRFAIVSRIVPAFLPQRLRLDWFSGIDGSGSIQPPAFLASEENRTVALANAQREYSGCLADFQLGGPPCEALRENLELCRRERISAALVLMPEGTDYRSWYRPADWACIERFLGDLSHEFGVPIINAREWIADDGFVDSHHLLPPGAIKFTDRLGHEVLAELVRAKLSEQ